MRVFKDWIFGPNGGATNRDLEKMIRRESFSEFLPWVAYDKDNCRYLNSDETLGYLWECTPVAFAGKSQMDTLEGLLNYDYPKNATMQVMLYADPDVEDIVRAYRDSKTRANELGQRSINELCKLLLKGTEGLDQMFGTPVRNFRLFLALKTPSALDTSLLANFEQNIHTLGLQPRLMAPPDLLKVMRRIFNQKKSTAETYYDDRVPIRKQIINAESIVKDHKKFLRVGPEDRPVYISCLTPKQLPNTIDTLETNELSGFIFKEAIDALQIKTPFLWSLNIVFDSSTDGRLSQKASITNAQRSTGSFAIQIKKRAEEFNWALHEMSDGKRFLRVIPSLLIFARNENQLLASTATAKNVWQKKKYVMQEESVLRRAVFLLSLPFGLYPSQNNLAVMDRDFPVPVPVAARMMPIQADFRGSLDKPAQILLGRKGQIIGSNVFSSNNNNHNYILSATSGSGKTFFINNFLLAHYSEGAKVRVVDIGYGYKKLCKIAGGNFLDFGKSHSVINPFHSTAITEEDKESDRIATANIIGEMVYSSSKNQLNEIEANLLVDAVAYAYREDPIYGVDAVSRYLAEFPKHASDELRGFDDVARLPARRMAFNLAPFRSTGIYGKFFNGKSTFDIGNDDFVVLELEQIKSKEKLFGVVIMQLLNAITQDLYLSDRGTPRFILFEEAWSYFDGGDRVGKVIVEGYRRARRYSGSFGIVTQSMTDMTKFGDAGDTMLENSDSLFMLQSPSYDKAVNEGIMSAPGLMLDMLKSLKKSNGRYSELFLDNPSGKGVGRLVVDPWNYWLATSSGKEVNQFMKLMDEHNDVVKVLEILSGVEGTQDAFELVV